MEQTGKTRTPRLTKTDAEELMRIISGSSDINDEKNTAWRNFLTRHFDPEEEEVRKAYRLDMLLEEFDAFAERLHWAKETGELIGPITGFKRLDDELCGALYPGLHVVTGNTGAGKTAFCLQIACQCGFPCLYVTCEMSALEEFRRIAARVSKNALHRFKNPRCCMSPGDMHEAAQKAAQSAPNLVLADSTRAFWNRSAIRDQAQQMMEISESSQILIVIDSLHSWASWLDADEYDRLNLALKGLRALAAELNSPVLYIAEQSKTANRENESGGDIGASAGAGFRGIEYGAESVFGLRAEMESFQENGKKRWKPIVDAFGCTPVWLTIHKNRNGSPHKPIKMTFDGALQTFSEAKEEEE